MTLRYAARAALLTAAAFAIELMVREVTRRSMVHALVGLTVSTRAAAAAGVACAAAAAVLRRRDSPRTVTLAVLIAAFVVGLAAQMSLGARLQSDGFYYYAYLRSIAFDRDVDFTNDYRMLGLGDKSQLFKATRTGHAQSAWTIGPAIVWSPFFAIGHVAAVRLHAAGVDVAADGTSFPYRQAVCVAGLFYGLLGCWFAFRSTRRIWPPGLATAAVVLTIAGSFMLWYLVAEPSMTHAPSMAAVAGFVWLWAATRERRSLVAWAALGIVAGLMSLIRWQNALFMVLPAIDVVNTLARSTDARARIEALRGGTTFLVCAVIAFLPQMVAWKAIYGSYIARSPIGPEIRWTDPHIVDVLFSARNGLLSTSPMLYLGAVGLLLLAYDRADIGIPALIATAVMVYFNACIQDWWGSAGFGGRRFDGTIPFFCFGLAAFIEAGSRLAVRHSRAVIVLALATLAAGNLGLMQAAHDGSVRIGETLAFDRAWGAEAHAIHGWVGNPFTYPASLVYALRNRVSPGDYDLLSTNRFLSDSLQPYGRVDVGGDDEWLIEDGWHAAEHDGGTTYRWGQQRAGLRIPLDHAAALRVQVRLHAFGYPGAPPQTVTIEANDRACAPIPVASDWHTIDCTLDKAAWHAGINHVVLVFAFAARPIDVGLGPDIRSLSGAVDWVRVSVTSPDSAP